MTHHWIEDDPLDGGAALAVRQSDTWVPGVAYVMGLGSTVSLLFMVLAAIALLD